MNPALLRAGWTDAVWRACERRTGLAPHYPFLYGTAVGIHAQRVLEFGIGESTKVLLAAMRVTGGLLMSISPGPVHHPPDPFEAQHWVHMDLRSDAVDMAAVFQQGDHRGRGWDLVVHDGSHAGNVVYRDLLACVPYVKQGGLILIHDVLHSYVGPDLSHGVKGAFTALTRAYGESEMPPYTALTLPWAFGLMVVRCNINAHLGTVVATTMDKPSSDHYTRLAF